MYIGEINWQRFHEALNFMKYLGIFILVFTAIPFGIQRKYEKRKLKKEEESLND